MWTERDSSMTSRVSERRRGADGVWTPPHQLGLGSADNKPAAVIDSHGVMSAIWFDATSGQVANASVTDQGWSDPHVLTPVGAGNRVVATSARGDGAVPWATDRGLAIAVRHADGTWDPTHVLPTVIHNGDTHVTIDGRGRVLALVTMPLVDEETGERRHITWASTRRDGSWTPTRYLDTRRHAVYGTSWTWP